LPTVPSDPYRETFLQIVERRPLIDNRFEGPRRIDAIGGSGNFSLVFTATDKATSTDVVLKFFHPGMVQDSYRWQSFQREAQLLEKLAGQKNIISLVAPRAEFVEVFSANGLNFPVKFSYYVVEKAICDLETVLNGGAVTAEEALQFFHEMCRAVQRIRAHQIAHRDLKPRNFLLMGNGAVKLADLGTARIYDGSDGISSSYQGPPGDFRYCAPEMLAILHDEIPEMALNADFYALGAILFELLTGTNLGATILSPALMNDIRPIFTNHRKGERKAAFDGVIAGIAAAYPLPRLSDFGSVAPASISLLVDDLYRSLGALDYRVRLTDFERIFYKIQVCLVVLRNAEKYDRWKKEKERRRQAAKVKESRAGDKCKI
jgi:serine/threonine protein kinase